MGSPSDAGNGRININSIETVKRRIYLIASPAGSLAIGIVWSIEKIQGSLSSWDLVVLPTLAITVLILVILLWRRVIHLRSYEAVVYAASVLYSVSEFFSVLSHSILTRGTFTSNFTLWIPFVYILGFLILSLRRALIFSILYFVSIVAIGIGCLLRFSLSGVQVENISLLAQIYLASLFYIVLLYTITKVQDYYNSDRSMVDAMSKMAMTDPLTKVDNRRLLDKLIQDEIHRVERHPHPLSILLFDLDHFKRVNDTFGHNTGDVVLQEVALLLRQIIRASDPFGRWGGDEFLCLATNTDGKQATELAERLREALQRNPLTRVGIVTASFGVTSYQPGDTPETLVRRADMGLYKAKAGGRNRVEVVTAGVTLPLFEGEKPQPEAGNGDDEGDRTSDGGGESQE